METLGQRDPKWSNIKLGFSDGTIGEFGCVITCLAMILGTTPDVVNDRLKAVNGFSDGTTLGKGNLIVWSKIADAFPGVTSRRVWTYNNDDVKANVPNVIVEVPAYPIGGTGLHYVNYIGNHQLRDPWENRIRSTADFPNPTGYCVITGTWNQHPGEDVLVNAIAAEVNGNDDPHTKIEKIKQILSV